MLHVYILWTPCVASERQFSCCLGEKSVQRDEVFWSVNYEYMYLLLIKSISKQFYDSFAYIKLILIVVFSMSRFLAKMVLDTTSFFIYFFFKEGSIFNFFFMAQYYNLVLFLDTKKI